MAPPDDRVIGATYKCRAITYLNAFCISQSSKFVEYFKSFVIGSFIGLMCKPLTQLFEKYI